MKEQLKLRDLQAMKLHRKLIVFTKEGETICECEDRDLIKTIRRSFISAHELLAENVDIIEIRGNERLAVVYTYAEPSEYYEPISGTVKEHLDFIANQSDFQMVLIRNAEGKAIALANADNTDNVLNVILKAKVTDNTYNKELDVWVLDTDIDMEGEQQ